MSGKHTPGPWAWFGNASTNTLYLATVHSGRQYVMDFTRWGSRGAQPRFQPGKGVMVDAKDLLQFEVGDQSIVGVEAAKKDAGVYRLDVRGIQCADAALIAAAPELLEALQLAEHWLANSLPVADIDKPKPLPIIRAAIAKAEGRAP